MAGSKKCTLYPGAGKMLCLTYGLGLMGLTTEKWEAEMLVSGIWERGVRDGSSSVVEVALLLTS